MKNALFSSLICLSFNLVAQQSAILGEVSVINSQYETGKRQYVQNAQVEEIFGKAQATTTDATGQFRLTFVGVAEKASINFEVKKEGFDVVNADVLNAVAGQQDKIKVYMATPNKITDYKKQYYKIGKTSAEKALESKLKRLQTERSQLQASGENNLVRIQDLEKQLAEVEEKRKKIEDNAKELAQRYAPINLDDVAPLYQEAFSFFQKGDLEQALKILQNAQYSEQAEKILQERNLITTERIELDERDAVQRQRTTDAIQGLSLKADLHKTRFEFDSTAVCYDLMIRLDSNDIGVLRQYASFLAFQNQYDKAIVYYKRLLNLTTTDEVKATLLNKLANAYQAKKEMPQAGEAYHKALTLFRQLAEKNSATYLPYVALTLNNIGQHIRMVEKNGKDNTDKPPKGADVYFEEALKIYKQLAIDNKTDYQAYIAMTLNNLGRAYYDNQRLWKALDAFEDCLTIYEALAQNNPDALIPSDIQNFIELSLTFDNNDKEAHIFDKSSERLLTRALKVHRQFAVKNPVFLPIVALSLNNLGFIYANHKKVSQAEAAYNEALKILRDLVYQNPIPFPLFWYMCLVIKENLMRKWAKKSKQKRLTMKRWRLRKNMIFTKINLLSLYDMTQSILNKHK